MPNLYYTATEIVAQLKQLLTERYRRGRGELGVLKEIVQNADDAGATRLDFVLSRNGIEGADNPLLRGPSLACINDGSFRREDERALRTMGRTSKAEDLGAIGRFGVGQKSVFHLAEAYFYMGSVSDGADGGARTRLANVIDPWSEPEDGDPVWKEWDAFSPTDQDQVERLVQETFAKVPPASWFVLYLPLRRKEHQRGEGGLLDLYCPDVDELARELARMWELGALIEQLRWLREVNAWERRPGAEMRPLGRVFRRGPERGISRPRHDKVPVGSVRRFQSLVDVQGTAQASGTLRVVGVETCASDSEVSAYTQDPHWPRRHESSNREVRSVIEKVAGHGAVTIVCTGRANDTAGALTLAWAVFLPLGSDPESVAIRGSALQWRIILHGYFFPDSGRRGVAWPDEGTPHDRSPEEIVRAKWNGFVRDRATLQCLLPALWDVVREPSECSAEDCEALARALAESDLWSRGRSVAASSQALVWGPGERESEPKWPEARAVLLSICRPTATEREAARNVIAALRRAETLPGVTLVWEDSPRLCARTSWDPWPREALERALEPELALALKDDLALRYFRRCLAVIQTEGGELSAALHRLLRRVLRERLPLSREETRNDWIELIRRCDPQLVLWSRANLTFLYDLAVEVPCDAVVLPVDLRPPTWNSSPVLAVEDVVTLLRFAVERIDKESAQRLAAEVVSAFGVQNVLAQESLRGLAVLRVWSARKGTNVFFTAAEVESLRGLGLAFLDGGIGRPQEAARALLKAIASPELDVLLAQDDVAAAFELPSVSDESLARLFALSCPPLQGVTERIALIRVWVAGGGTRVLSAERVRTVPLLRRALRTLIHGVPDRREDDSKLFYLDDRSAVSDAFARALFELLGASWRLVPTAVENEFVPPLLREFSIESLRPSNFVTVLREATFPVRERVGRQLNDQDLVELRRVLALASDEELMRSLPIHRSVRGTVVRLDDPGVYLRDQWAFPTGLSSAVELVIPDELPTMTIQKRVGRGWTPETQIAVCLGQPSPSTLSQELLDAFGAIARNLSDENPLLRRIRETPWLPTSRGGAARPAELYALPAPVDDAVRALFGDRSPPYVSPRELPDQTREHPAFRRWERLILNSEDETWTGIAKIVGALRQEQPTLTILPYGTGQDTARLVEVARQLEQFRHDPGWRFATTVLGAPSVQAREHTLALIDALRGELAAERLVELLSSFVEVPEYPAVRDLFECYLKAAAERADFDRHILPRIKLRSEAGTWRTPDQLARSGTNLDVQFRIEARLARILDLDVRGPDTNASVSSTPSRTRRAPDPKELSRAAEVLATYLAPWKRRVAPQALGYFVAILGDGERNELRALAERLLTNESVEGARNRLFRVFARSGIEFSRAEKARYAFELVTPGQKIETESVLGTPLHATVASAATTLFVGRVPRNGETALVRLRNIDGIEGRSAHDLTELLRTSIVRLLEEGFSLALDGMQFETFWRGLVQGGQAQVESVRAVVLERLPIYLEALVGRREALLRRALRELDDAEEQVRERSHVPDMELKFQAEAQDRLNAARRALLDLVKTDDVRRRLVEAVRRKVEAHQYAIEQVVFELFQNADDAAAQIVEMQPSIADTTADYRRFVVDEARTEKRVRVRHWGRAINQHQGDGRFTEGRERGYHLDLHHMLVLHLSEKTETTTGKFGLGFKSVYLVADTPRIVSGSLSFEIVGGLLPEWVPREEEHLDTSTTIDLPLRTEVSLESVLRDFLDYGGLLTVFAQTLRRVEFRSGSGATVEADYAPTPVPEVPNVEVVNLRTSLRAERASERLLVVRRTGTVPTLVLAIPLQEGEVGRFREVVPTVWCTAPTVERWGVGYSFNGPFQLDVGRGQLARSNDENDHVLRALGDMLGAALEALHRTMQARFEQTAHLLALPMGPQTERRFWASVFERFTEPFSHHDALRLDPSVDVRAPLRLLHGEGRGVTRVVSACRALPSGLSNRHEVLTSVGEVRWVIDPAIADARVFQCIAALPWFEKNVVPGAAVHARIGDVLARLGCNLRDAERLSLASLLDHAYPEDRVLSEQDASALARLYKALDVVGGGPLTEFKERAARWLWETRAGRVQRAGELLLNEDFRDLVRRFPSERRDELFDELKRARFAPPEFLLHQRFALDVETVEFFRASRRSLSAGAERLASWAIDATSEDARRGVVGYLAQGYLARELASFLRNRGFHGLHARNCEGTRGMKG